MSNAWDYEYGSPEAAVGAFMADAAEYSTSAAGGIAELFLICADEAERRLLLGDLGWGYAPRPGMLDELLIWTRAVLVAGQAT